jgi:hypothetical protein
VVSQQDSTEPNTSNGQSGSSKFDGVLTTTGEVPFVGESPITLEKDETLWCTPRGQVAALDATKTVFTFTRAKSRQLAKSRNTLRRADLRSAIVDVLKLPTEKLEVPDYRNWRYLGSRDYPTQHAMAYTVTTEPGMHAIVYRLMDERWHSRPPQAGQRAILYVAHLSSDDELRTEPLIRETIAAEPDVPVFACDVRGVGESMPDTCNPGSFHSEYGSDYFYAIHSLMLDRPYLGQKTFDVLRVLEWLESIGHNEIHLLGRGWGALSATLAAVLSDRVQQVTLKHSLTSYQDIAESEHYRWPLSCLLPNVLARFDLPDCYNELQTKKLRQIDPWDASGAPPKGGNAGIRR